MYTVTYVSQDKPHKSDEIPLLSLAVDFLATLTKAERKTAKVMDSNPKGDVTELARETLKERQLLERRVGTR